MGRIIVANRHGDQVIEWDPAVTDTEEARGQVAAAEQILKEARERGCAISRKVDGRHVIDTAPFDPNAEEYQIIAPIAGGQSAAAAAEQAARRARQGAPAGN